MKIEVNITADNEADAALLGKMLQSLAGGNGVDKTQTLVIKEPIKKEEPAERKISQAVAEAIKEEPKEEKKVLNFTNGPEDPLTLDKIRLKTQEILKIEDKKYYPDVKNLLTEFNAVNVATLKPDQYQKYYDRLLKIVP